MAGVFKQIVGKTVAHADWIGEEFYGCDNRCLEIKFTDGTCFSFNVLSKMSGEVVMFKTDSDEQPTKLGSLKMRS